MSDSTEQKGFPRIWIAKDNFDENGRPYQDRIRVYAEEPRVIADGCYVMVPEALLSEAVREEVEENKILSKQITECMEFLIWLKGSNYVDYEIEDRLIKLLEVLAASTDGGKGGGDV